MKNLHTNRKVNQQTTDGSLKKPPKFFVFVLCLLIMVIIAVTTMLLGSSLSKFADKESNTITLAASENVSDEHKKDGNTTDKNTTDKNTTGKNTNGKNKAGAGNQPAGYHGDLNVKDEKLKWSTETHVDLFKESYGDTVKSDKKDKNIDKRIAPGTSNYYDFTVKNDGNIPLDYSVSLEIDTFFDGKSVDSEIPIEWRLLNADKDVVSDWQTFSEKSEVLNEGTLDLRHRDSYTIEWRWVFERGQDKADTELGNMSVNKSIGVDATIFVEAEQSADWDGKISVLPHTGDIFNPVLYVVLLVISICMLLILVVVYKRRKKDEDIQDEQG